MPLRSSSREYVHVRGTSGDGPRFSLVGESSDGQAPPSADSPSFGGRKSSALADWFHFFQISNSLAASCKRQG